MSIKIHHGPNGSYKTSGAIQDDAVPALKAGRIVVTNVRGFTLERVLAVYPDLPESASIINLDFDNTDDLNRMRTWWQWVPQGAFIIFDETQLLFPKSWKDSDLKLFDYTGGIDQAKIDNRPINWLDAWTRHRHFGWDVVLTTPNITYIRDDIRATCEMAYKHSNMAVIGWKGRYKEAMHLPTQNVPSGDFVNEYKKIKQEIFKLYDSTATGTVRDTQAGKNIFRSPKLLFFTALPICILIYIFSTGKANPLAVLQNGGKSQQGAMVANQTGSAQNNTVSSVHSSSGSSVPVNTGLSTVNHPYANTEIYIKGVIYNPKQVLYLIAIQSESHILEVNSLDLRKSGYKVSYISDCVAKLAYQEQEQFIVCKGKQFDSKKTGSALDFNKLANK